MEVEREESTVGDLGRSKLEPVVQSISLREYTHIEAISKFQLILLPGLHKKALCSPSSPTSRSSQAGERGGGPIRTEKLPDDKVSDGRD